MKSYTDLPQSKKLAEILPIESADMKEEWKDIEGYEGLYMVSNFGRVVSIQGCNPRIMKLGTTHKGYQCVGLQKEKQHKTCVVHRLVAQAFIPNPDNLPQVNHKDECKTNNRVDNLEWCTDKYNHNYGTYIERQRNFHPRNTPVLMFDLNGNFEKSIDNCSKSYDGVFYLNSYYDIELNKNYIITGNCGYCKSFDFEEGKLYNKYFDNDSYCMGLIIVKHLFIYNNDGKIKLIEINTLSNMKIWDFHSKELLTKIESKEEIFAACLWNNEYLLFGGKNCLIKVFDLSKKVIVDTLFNKDEKNNILDIKVINHPLYGKSLIFLEGKIIKISKIVVE
jgi:WD40 repeat protein